jgi:hypothetical protein
MANTRDSALLAAAAEAVSWNHESQPDQPRKGQRVIISKKDLPQLEEFLATSDPNVDPEDGHPIAFETILQEADKFEVTPLFLNENSEPVTSDLFLSEKVPEWMAKTKQVATGSRRRVLENGRDVVNSSDEDDPNMKPDELTGMYTAEMDPKAGPKVLTQAEVAFQRAAARAVKDQVPRATSPDGKEDWNWMNPQQLRLATAAANAIAQGKTKAPPRPATPSSDPEVQTPAKAAPLEIKTAPKPKAAAPPRAPSYQPNGTKVPTPAKGQQVPKKPTDGRHPIATPSSDGSRAGGFRPGVGGSGQKDTCVASSHPSQT